MKDLAKKIDELTKLLDQHGLTAITVREGENEIEIRREAAGTTQVSIAGAPQPSRKQAGVPMPSPLTGIFYRKPSPDEPEYVKEGDRIERGDIIGIIEAMKVFNPVEATVAGVIKSFAVEDGNVLQEGDPILWLEP
jgi:acetyl-CoA carboxylase biotin carboxyl carrier protein